MFEFYLRLLIAGVLSMTLLTLNNQMYIWFKFVIVSWRIAKPAGQAEAANGDQIKLAGASLPDLIFNSTSYLLCAALFILILFKVDIPTMPTSLKAIISLSVAQIAYLIPLWHGGYRKNLQDTLKDSKVWLNVIIWSIVILTVLIGTILCVPYSLLGFGLFLYNLRHAKVTRETAVLSQMKNAQDSLQEDIEALTSPQRLFYADMISFTVLAGMYWYFGFRENWVLFVAPALLLVIANRMFSTLVGSMKKEEDTSQLRAINPVAFAGTLIILFSFYIALLLDHPERSTLYLTASALFLGVLWYFCYLSRRETTIEVARDAYPSNDYDFQVDSSNAMLSIFSRLIWFLHPVFFAIGLHRSGEANGPLLVEAWFDSMVVAVAMTLVYTLTCLYIWTRNIRKPELDLPKEGRLPYPEYRDNLAASALPYCVIIPALTYALLNLLGLSPISLPGIESGTWLDISIYVAFGLVLIGFFVQLPYRSGARAWKSPRLKGLETQVEQTRNDIESRRDKFVKSRSSVIAMKNISDELTLHRLTNEINNENSRKKLNYNITWPGEIGKDSALYIVLSFGASAVTTAIATNLDAITKLLLGTP